MSDKLRVVLFPSYSLLFLLVFLFCLLKVTSCSQPSQPTTSGSEDTYRDDEGERHSSALGPATYMPTAAFLQSCHN
ncbi:uncharacterized protein IWZ02DRAFT_447552 [Phyllosticta citriasiana]|uniref:Uncharacterized protein n=1 Tax=Phyllosticta citriasiana TaxID=595635 RepID=A0ABR1KNQ3_9PEZI